MPRLLQHGSFAAASLSDSNREKERKSKRISLRAAPRLSPNPLRETALYPDAPEISSWADETIHWMVMNEIILGKYGEIVSF